MSSSNNREKKTNSVSFWGKGESKQAQGNSVDIYGASRSRVYYSRQYEPGMT